MTTEIHPTAVIAKGAKLGEGVTVGPYCVVSEHVELADGVHLHSHVVIDGYTKLAAGVEVFPFASIGTRPQDLKYDGSPTTVEVGERTVLREYVTVQPGTAKDPGIGYTRVGSDCLIMAYCHIAHDCVVGDRVIMANSSQLGGHVTISDNAILGGVTTVHQFARIGARAITGASARVQQDVPPFCMADGHPARLFGLNNVGLKRAGIEQVKIDALKKAYRSIFSKGPYAEALKAVQDSELMEHEEVRIFCEFLEGSQRGVTRARRRARAEDG